VEICGEASICSYIYGVNEAGTQVLIKTIKVMDYLKLVKSTQKLVDEMVPGVIITVANDPDNNDKMLVGSYDCPKYGRSSHVERIDRFFTDATLFLMFFKQRIKYMNASKEEQLSFDGHPATF
tara:strand:- start:1127 stop:1495 length:369 start_codon:yes stop_codon:yes gene_type:complete